MIYKYLATATFNTNIKAKLVYEENDNVLNLISVFLICSNINSCNYRECIFSHYNRYEESIPAEWKCDIEKNYNLYNCEIINNKVFRYNNIDFIITNSIEEKKYLFNYIP